MAIKYVDPSASTNGTGTYASPYNVPPADFGLSANDILLFKAGTTWSGRRQYNAAGIIIGAYGNGPKPIWLNGSDDRCLNLATAATNTVRDIRFISDGLRCIGNDSSVAQATVMNHRIIGNTFDCIPHSSGADNNCAQLYGAGIKVLSNIITRSATDGFWLKGDNAEFAYNRISNVAADGREAGDCIQLDNGDAPYVHHNYLDHSQNDGKQCVILSGGTPATSRFEYNYCKHYRDGAFNSNALFSNATDATFKGNIIDGGNTGIWFAGGGTAESNLIINDQTNGIMCGLVAGTFLLQNNTIVSPLKTGLYGARYSSGTAPTSLTTKNNIFVGWQTRGLYMLATSGFTNDYNWFWDNVSNSDAAIGSNSIIDDPRFDSSYMPHNFLAHLKATAGATLDVYKETFVTSFGAIQPSIINFDDTMLPYYYSINGNT